MTKDGNCIHCLQPVKPRIRLIDGEYVEQPAECQHDLSHLAAIDWAAFKAEQIANQEP